MTRDFYTLFDKPEPSGAPLNVTLLDPARASRYAAKALISECENVAAAVEGTRNDTLNTAAFSIAQIVAAGHLGHDDAWASLADAARSSGLEDTEIDRTLASGFSAGVKTPRVVPDLAPIPQPTVLTVDSEDTIEKLLPLLDWHELWDREDEEQWIVEPLLPVRRAVALYSAPKVGKSLLMLEVAVGIARASEVLGVTPDRPRRVLYVDFENDPRGDIRTRLESMEIGPDDLANLCYLSFPSLAKLDTAMGGMQLVAAVQHYECEVVVIDTVSRAVAGEENANDTWLNFYRNTGLILKSLGVACIRLDHTGKNREKGMRGGSAKYGDVDAVWKLEMTAEDTLSLECTDNRMPVTQRFLALSRESYPLRHTVIGTHWSDTLDAQAKQVDTELDQLGVPSSSSVRECGRRLREAGIRVKNEALARAVKARKLRLDIPLEGDQK